MGPERNAPETVTGTIKCYLVAGLQWGRSGMLRKPCEECPHPKLNERLQWGRSGMLRKPDTGKVIFVTADELQWGRSGMLRKPSNETEYRF